MKLISSVAEPEKDNGTPVKRVHPEEILVERNEIRREELAVQRRQLDLEERRLEMDRERQKEEREERARMMQLLMQLASK